MRIGIDAHMVGSRETGNETYCLGLIEGLEQIEDHNQYMVYLTSPTVLPSVNGHGRLLRRMLRRGSSAWRLLMGFAQASRSDRLDVLHVTYNVPFFTRCPLVVSVHDISYVHFPEFFSKRDLRLLSTYVPYSLKAARHVLTLSESAAQDIERVYGVPRSKISVVPLAARAPYTSMAEPTRVAHVREIYGLSEPYVLAVGNLQPRKNLLRLVEAVAQLPAWASDLKLALVGKAQWRESDIYRRVTELGLQDRVVFTGYVSDEDLAHLYHGSHALVYPSLYEGFGLPVLEAMSCGTPVICSNTSSMPEVAGDAAIMIDPLNISEMADAIGSVVKSNSLREQLRHLGFARAASFSWLKTACQTLKVYEQCA
jgi:glycosyltransferase involved in cell wall biosynthesis